MAAKRGLGKGLDSLIPNKLEDETKKAAVTAGSKEVSQEDGPVTIVNITKVEPNRDQPRKNFDEDALEELAESIKQYGLLQPILVQDRKTYYYKKLFRAGNCRNFFDGKYPERRLKSDRRSVGL